MTYQQLVAAAIDMKARGEILDFWATGQGVSLKTDQGWAPADFPDDPNGESHNPEGCDLNL